MRILEGLPLRCLVEELSATCQSSRIQQITITEDRETCLHLYRKDCTGWLVISCHPEKSALYFQPEKPGGEKTRKSGWERVLTKYLSGGKIEKIAQVGWDRVITLTVRNPGLWGDHITLLLFAELTGRNANCVLTLPDTQHTILGAFRQVTEQQSRYRIILPGSSYHLPPQNRKRVDPLLFADQAEPEPPIPPGTTEEMTAWLIRTVDGIGPRLAQWITERARHGSDRSLQSYRLALRSLVEPLRNHSYRVILLNDSGSGKPLGIQWDDPASPLPDGMRNYRSFNLALAEFQKADREWHTRELESARRNRVIMKELDYIRREEEKIHSLLLSEKDISDLHTKGELLKIHASRPQPGLHELRVPNLLSENTEEVTIQLDPRLSIGQNIQRYFHRYRRAVQRNKQLIAALDSLRKKKALYQTSLDTGNVCPELEESDDSGPSGKLSPASTVRRYRSPLGNEILAGKNHRDNHLLVSRLAHRNDYWFHARDLPGSHVLLKIVNFQLDPRPDFLRSARLAAFLSPARRSVRAEVIMARMKHIRLIPGGTIGKVTFRNEQTLVVEPGHPPELTPFDLRTSD